jgi:hypothetical protein
MTLLSSMLLATPASLLAVSGLKLLLNRAFDEMQAPRRLLAAATHSLQLGNLHISLHCIGQVSSSRSSSSSNNKGSKVFQKSVLDVQLLQQRCCCQNHMQEPYNFVHLHAKCGAAS